MSSASRDQGIQGNGSSRSQPSAETGTHIPSSPQPQSYLRREVIGDAVLYLGDCRAILPTLGAVDALVTDPPYGIGEARQKNGRNPTPGRSRLGTSCAVVDWGSSDWDDDTKPEELAAAIALAKWAVVFGGNYYPLPPTRCWLVWDKLNSGDFADCELAWTNLDKAVRRLRYLWNGMIKAPGETRGDHPTQKPVGVMKWALQQLPPVRTVLDPFMGSGTTGVACAGLGLGFVGIEREPTYFEAAYRRIAAAYAQPRLQLDAALSGGSAATKVMLPGIPYETGEV